MRRAEYHESGGEDTFPFLRPLGAELYQRLRLRQRWTNWTKIEERIQAAEAAIKGKLHEFSLNHGGTPEENQAIEDANERVKRPETRGRGLAGKADRLVR